MTIKTIAIPTLLLLLLPAPPGAAQETPTRDFDAFREFFSRSSWETASYGLQDHVGYEYYGYLDVPFGGYETWDYRVEADTSRLTRRPDLTGERLYVGRTGGVFRGEWYTPDEIGRIYRDHGLYYGSMGASLVETEWILKKYGLRHIERIPGHVRQVGLTGFTESDYARYEDSLRVMARRELEAIRDRERAYDVSIIDDPATLWLLTGSGIMHVFLDSLENNYHRFNETFSEEMGFDIPVVAHPETPRDRAQHSLFLQWVRTRMHSLIALQVEVFRDVVDPAGRIISNIHGEDVIDYERHGAIVDHPGPSARAQFSSREMVLQHWNSYIFRLWRDLTDRRLFASSRINNGVIRARSIPARGAVELWHNQALQNGTVGFYQWLRDYGPRDAQGNQIETFSSFRGPAFANPDPSALGPERWEAVLDISRTLAHTRTFDPPPAETGILVAFDALNVDGWDRLFSLFVELTRAEVWSGFVSDREILDGTEDLSRFEVLYVPVLDYTRPAVVRALTAYVEGGGTLVAVDPTVLRYDMSGNDITAVRAELFGIEPVTRPVGPRSLRLSGSYGDKLIHSPGTTVDLSPLDGTEVIGRYADGGAAVTRHRLGRGQAMFWAAPLANLYSANPYGDPELDGRGAFYKALESESGAQDLSWIWEITYRNLRQVTGSGDPDLPPVRTEIPLN